MVSFLEASQKKTSSVIAGVYQNYGRNPWISPMESQKFLLGYVQLFHLGFNIPQDQPNDPSKIYLRVPSGIFFCDSFLDSSRNSYRKFPRTFIQNFYKCFCWDLLGFVKKISSGVRSRIATESPPWTPSRILSLASSWILLENMSVIDFLQELPSAFL